MNLDDVQVGDIIEWSRDDLYKAVHHVVEVLPDRVNLKDGGHITQACMNIAGGTYKLIKINQKSFLEMFL
jgi:hypothetical protein